MSVTVVTFSVAAGTAGQRRRRVLLAAMLAVLVCQPSLSQTFTLEHRSDTLSVVVLTSGGGQRDEWPLPYPVYRFQTADVDGDGTPNALVGVVKSTRFHPEVARRLFVFKPVRGRVRPLWLGSKLGGVLHDFHFADGLLTALEQSPAGGWALTQYRWEQFGFTFVRFLLKDVARETAARWFTQMKMADKADGQADQKTARKADGPAFQSQE